MRNKFDFRNPVYHKKYGELQVQRYLEDPTGIEENQYDCGIHKLIFESELMNEEEYNLWILSESRNKKILDVLK